ncbi:MAG: RNA polymerase factor sigma-54 [Bacillota bacterium]|nr:RNA polymerase factor sigma-54 [Bacillota bacterium]
MKLGYNLKLEQTQKLIITPELKLAITLLQYSTLELQDHIQEELLNNPVLEIQDNREEEKNKPADLNEEHEQDQTNDDEFPWEEYFRDMDVDMSFTRGSLAKGNDERPSVENCAGAGGTMLEDLLSQLRMLSLSDRQYRITAFLAGNLDHKGYLQGEIEELSAALGAPAEELEEALAILQKLEPTGIGCRNLQECLLLQLNRMERVPEQALKIVKRYLPAAADGRFAYISSRLGCTEKEVEEAVSVIRTLNPKPGSIFVGGDETRYIVPDVIVEKVDDRYVIMSNDNSAPQLTINPFYKRMLSGGTADEKLTAFIKNKIERAYWLIRSIEQRRLTLFRVSQQIIDLQRPFLDEGIKKLKPLTLKEVAVNVGVHESTVSRATANKYIQTPRGLFPLKFFFSSGISGSEGADYSSRSIKKYIHELVDAEDPGKPLSDQHLAEILREKGISISRRTVAKYREEISIPASYKRRRNTTVGRKQKND